MPNEINELNGKANRMELDWWMNHDLFSFQWWVIVIVNVVSLILLVVFIDRKRTKEITLALMFSYVIVGFFDELGKFFQWWGYPHQFKPYTKNFNAVNFLLVPSVIALMYQWFSLWRSFLIADLVAAGVNAFIGEPIFVLLGIYKLNNWTYFKSFLVLFVIGIVVKGIVDSFGKSKNQAQDDSEFTFNFFRMSGRESSPFQWGR